MQTRTAITAGCGLSFSALGLALFTAWFNWNRYIFHTGAAVLFILGLFVIWYALHRSWYDKMVQRVIRNIEEKVDKEMGS